MKGSVSEETFATLESSSQMLILFETISELRDIVKQSEEVPCKYHQEMFVLVKDMDKRKRVDVVASLGGGIIGGVAAVLGKAIFWR